MKCFHVQGQTTSVLHATISNVVQVCLIKSGLKDACVFGCSVGPSSQSQKFKLRRVDLTPRNRPGRGDDAGEEIRPAPFVHRRGDGWAMGRVACSLGATLWTRLKVGMDLNLNLKACFLVTLTFCLISLASVASPMTWRGITGFPTILGLLSKSKILALKHFRTLSGLWDF